MTILPNREGIMADSYVLISDLLMVDISLLFIPMVMVPAEDYLLSIEPFEPFLSHFIPVAETKISGQDNSIPRSDYFIVVLDNSLIHLFYRVKWPITIFNYIGVIKVLISCKPPFHFLLLKSSKITKAQLENSHHYDKDNKHFDVVVKSIPPRFHIGYNIAEIAVPIALLKARTSKIAIIVAIAFKINLHIIHIPSSDIYTSFQIS